MIVNIVYHRKWNRNNAYSYVLILHIFFFDKQACMDAQVLGTFQAFKKKQNSFGKLSKNLVVFG